MLGQGRLQGCFLGAMVKSPPKLSSLTLGTIAIGGGLSGDSAHIGLFRSYIRAGVA